MARGKLVCLEGLLGAAGPLPAAVASEVDEHVKDASNGREMAGATDNSWGASCHVAELEGATTRVEGGVRGGEVCAGG